MIDYNKKTLFSSNIQHQMMLIEGALVRNEYCTSEQLKEEIGVTTDRKVQDVIKHLKECYDGVNDITRGPKYRLIKRDRDLLFPEHLFTLSDSKLLNEVLKLAAMFDGAIPMKSILNASGVETEEVSTILNGFSSVMDVQLRADEANLISLLYKAIDEKKPIAFSYPSLYNNYSPHKGKLVVSPYYLGRYNNKWFLIAGISNLPKNVANVKYPWSVFPLQRILNEESDVTYCDELPYKAIEVDRIKKFYKNVMGFYVPSRPLEPFHEDLNPLEIQIRAVNDKILRYLEENPIHSSQKIVNRETKVVQLTVVENPSLYKALLSFGSDIEVVLPQSVRTKMKENFAKGLDNYVK